MDNEALRAMFSGGTIELKGQFTLGSNYTFLVSVDHEGRQVQAVYKPQKGEQPLWDFPENTLAGREVAAYHVSEALGWDIVPFTIFRQDGPVGAGSLQKFIEYNPNYHYFNLKPDDKQKLRRVALFDHLTNNADRKGSHIFFEKGTHHLYAIDHGLCFNIVDKLRTVIWDFAREPISPGYLQDLQKIVNPSADLIDELMCYLNQDEVSMLCMRAEILIEGGIFPEQPAGRRAFPYPPL